MGSLRQKKWVKFVLPLEFKHVWNHGHIHIWFVSEIKDKIYLTFQSVTLLIDSVNLTVNSPHTT